LPVRSPHPVTAVAAPTELDLGHHVHLGVGLLATPPRATELYRRRRERRRRGLELALALGRTGARTTVVSDRRGAIGASDDPAGVALGPARRPHLPAVATIATTTRIATGATLHLHLDDLRDVGTLTAVGLAHRGPLVLHLVGAIGQPRHTGDAATIAHRVLGRPVERRLLRRADVVAVGTDRLADAVADAGGRCCVVMPPAVLPPPADVGPLGTAPAGRRVVGIGPLTPRRRTPALVRVLAELPADVHLVLLGTGADRLPLERTAAELGVGDRVHIRPTASWRTVARELAHATAVAAAPLVCDDPDGLLLAMAHGRPVVATDVDGIRQVVSDGVDGHLVAPLDERGLAGALAELLARPAAAAELGASAQRRVTARDWDAVARELLGALRADGTTGT
jgi:glycosyltransferase involved in cell wall biosynthesis